MIAPSNLVVLRRAISFRKVSVCADLRGRVEAGAFKYGCDVLCSPPGMRGSPKLTKCTLRIVGNEEISEENRQY